MLDTWSRWLPWAGNDEEHRHVIWMRSSASDSSMLEFVRYTNFVIIIIIIM